MSLRNWFAQCLFPSRRFAEVERPRRKYRPVLERLEERVTPVAAVVDPFFGVNGRVAIGGPFLETANDVVALPNGKVIAVGNIMTSANNQDWYIAQFNRDGSLDMSFSSDGTDIIDFGVGTTDNATAVAITSYGDIVIAGIAQGTSGDQIGLARYLPNGTLDAGFGNGGTVTHARPDLPGHPGQEMAYASAMALNSFDAILIAGAYPEGFGVVKFNADGRQPDPNFGNGGVAYQDFGGGTEVGSVTDMAVLPGDQILVAGVPQYLNGYGFGVARFTSNGWVDTSFNARLGFFQEQTQSTAHPESVALAVQTNDKILLTGSLVTSLTPESRIYLRRLDADGTPDGSFNSGAYVETGLPDVSLQPVSVLVQPDQSLLVAGAAWDSASRASSDFILVRYEANGAQDTTFGLNGVFRPGNVEPENSRAATLRLDNTVVIVGDAQYSPNKNFGLASFGLTRRSLVLVPRQSVYTVGGSAIFDSFVADNGNPLANVRVDFFARRGQATVASGAMLTDANGKAQFSYQGTTAGVDDVTVVIHDTDISSSRSITWNPSDGYQAVMKLVGDIPPRPLGSDFDLVRAIGTHGVIARLLFNGQPVDGETISFQVKSLFKNLNGQFNVEENPNPNPVRTFTTGPVDFNGDGIVEPDEIGGCILDGITRGREARDEVIAFRDLNNNGAIDVGEDKKDVNNNGVIDAPEAIGSYTFDWIGGKPVVVPYTVSLDGGFGLPMNDTTIRAPLDRPLRVNLRLLRDIGYRGAAPDIYQGNPAEDGVDLVYQIIHGPHAGFVDRDADSTDSFGNHRITRLGNISFLLSAPLDGRNDLIHITGSVRTHLEKVGGMFVDHFEPIDTTITIDWLAPTYDLTLGFGYGDIVRISDQHIRAARNVTTTIEDARQFIVTIRGSDGVGVPDIPVQIRHVWGPNRFNIVGLPGDDDFIHGRTGVGGEAAVDPALPADTPGTDFYELLVDSVVRDTLTIDWLPAELLVRSDHAQQVTVSNQPYGPEAITFAFPKVASGGPIVVNEQPMPQRPANFQLGLGLRVFNFSTTATYTGPVTVTMRLGDNSGRGWNQSEAYGLRFFHFENGSWENRTIQPLSFVRNNLNRIIDIIITCRVDSLSPFAVFQAIGATPVAGVDNYSLKQNRTLTVVAKEGLLRNDTDADSPKLTATLVAAPAHGTLRLQANGGFVYTPARGFRGRDQFTYVASDGTYTSLPTPVTLDVGVTPVPPARVERVVINDGAAQRSNVNRITVIFSDRVTLLAGAFELRRQDGRLIAVKVQTSLVNNRTVAVLTFTGNGRSGVSLPNGRYTLTIRGNRVLNRAGLKLDGNGDGAPGGDAVTQLFRLFGDLDGDGRVGRRDLALGWGRT